MFGMVGSVTQGDLVVRRGYESNHEKSAES